MDEPKVNILLVDDNKGNLLALEATLESLGQNLVKANSGKEALKRLLKDEFAVILLDVKMPGMDGFETARLIRQREKTRHTPIIFLTGVSKSETHELQAYSLGAVDYLFKPIVPDIVKSKVAVFVDLFLKEKERERERERERQERELRRLEALSRPPQTTVTGRAFGVSPLRESAPERFNDMVRHYGDLMELALEQRGYKVDHDLSEKLQDLAEQLGFLNAGPRDVVDVHAAAMKQELKGANPQKARAHLDDGQLMVVELMGRLVSHYRPYAAVGEGEASSDSDKQRPQELRDHG